MSEFSKRYEPQNFENTLYKTWEEANSFAPKDSKTGNSYYIPMPPPNVTGKLHLGHALTLTLEDIMTRYHRMIGDSTLWVPGTDHAGIATQAKVEQKLAKEGITKFDLGREKFLQEVWKWKDEYHDNITGQVKKMGASADWSKEAFTLDPKLNRIVTKTFVDMYNQGLIYKGEYMVNYSPALNTVLSDIEVDYKEEQQKLYYITYFISGTDGELTIATTRPETLLGDVAIAVNPKDKRYKKLLKLGKKVILPILNKEIPIIADDFVDIEFGTGVVKITPAHDPNDFEVAKRHGLPMDQVVLGKDGKMTKEAGIFAGQDFKTARANIVELLKSKGNLEKIEEYTSRVGYCSRSGCKVETIISTQWFVKVEELAKKVQKGYEKKEFEIIPKRFNKTFEDWIYNLRDWCISRQLWWGHQIPAYYNKVTGEMIVTEEELDKTNPELWERDNDVLDTWFSSGLWPFSVLDYDEANGNHGDLYKKFYPASMLETGYDIIFFWVIRMLLFGYHLTEQTPFKQIYLHGLVRDKNGKKMSKSLGNGIDPLDMIEKYGTDALRLTLSIGNTPGNDIKFDEDNVENNKLFINKLWNAVRFVHANLFEKGDYKLDSIAEIEKRLAKNYDSLMIHEKWILSRLKGVSDLLTQSMKDNNFSESGIELQAFTRNEFCDYYIEEFKILKDKSKFGNDVIIYTINHILKLWHPYIPFVTEELYDKLGFDGLLIDADWSKVAFERNTEVEKAKDTIIETIKAIRNIRAENSVMPDKTIKVYLQAKAKVADAIEQSLDIISGIVKSEHTEIITKKPKDDNLVYATIKAGVDIYVDTSNALDMESELTRLQEQITDTREYIAILDKKLLNESFVKRAPAELVRAEMMKKEEAKERLIKLEEKLEKMG
ncbi:MAG: valine--tRNA ligase [Candidatus Gracilibacteria bacterium]|nr:valine--tRNA ligase [Candidatus Gracilibacteria bacterium]